MTGGTTLACGCRLVEKPGDFAHLYPCSAAHRVVAGYVRAAGSNIIIHSVRKEEES